jgi:hypothetical protein
MAIHTVPLGTDVEGRAGMNGAEVRAHVRAAVQRGELPAGGPSDLAARDLPRDLSTWATDAAARIATA